MDKIQNWQRFPGGRIHEQRPRTFAGPSETTSLAHHERYDVILRESPFGGMKRVIRGPAGTGKSCVMLYAVHKARKKGWLVLYIPRGK